MNNEELKKKYNNLLEKFDEVYQTCFRNDLCKSNNIDVLTFHYRILKNKENELLFYLIRGHFYKHGKILKRFLLKKLYVELDPDLKAEALFLLGTMKH